MTNSELLEIIDWLIGHMPFTDAVLLTKLPNCPPLIKERIEVLTKKEK